MIYELAYVLRTDSGTRCLEQSAHRNSIGRW